MDPDLYYDGIPVTDLIIVDVAVPDPTHLTRSLRYPGAEDVDPAAAAEASMDPFGPIARDPRSSRGKEQRP